MIIGAKIAQSQMFTPQGVRIPVTQIQAGPCVVVRLKTMEKDGYSAVLVGFGNRRVKTISKATLGTVKKAGLDKSPPRFLREIPIDHQNQDGEQFKPGTLLTVANVFKDGDFVEVMGISKGKGFAGGVKRHHFKGGPRTHGQSDRERAPGSIGQTTTPGRVYKGKRMAGRMGSDTVTIKNLQVVGIDTEKNLLMIKGLVPGGKNSILVIKKLS